MVARPATYQDLLKEIRFRFPNVAAVDSLVVLFQPTPNDGPLENWVQVAPSAYGHVHDSAELFINVAHPLTKEYILPLPGRSVPNPQLNKRVRRTDGHGKHVGVEPGNRNFATENVQVSKTRHREVSSGPRGASQAFDNFSMSLELERPSGDAFASGWGGASERFRRSTKLVPDLMDCKEAVGQSVGQSNFYPADEEEGIANIKLGVYQGRYREQYRGQYQGQPPTDAGWYTDGEHTQMDLDRGQVEAQHLAGGLTEDQLEGEQGPQFYSDGGNRNWFAASSSPQNNPGALPASHRGSEMPTSPEWGHHTTAGWRWEGYRTPSPGQWDPYQGGYNFPDHVLTNGDGQHYGAREWSPRHHQSDTQYWRQDLHEEPASKANAGPHPRRDPTEVTYGSPRPRIQGSNSGWTTIGRKKNTWTDIPLQEESDPERAQPNDNGNNHAWDAQAPQQNFFQGMTSLGRGPGHRYGGDDTNGSQQEQRPGREISWGSDFWGGPPLNRNQRGAFTHDDTPASKHWR
ncbi:hypothetical protein KVR01_009016 [Diaporthe batatas]|uniref:uncharacterized protein n=1 Tax=Diaporthe batatas TaxID=748121 RepID=UPI001D05881A|nr:uncharacterized protein KVR01_009016 [Diaporthe batatas]KAG8160752.1 hypothetical protein KVR01_009016 [Diaporthe batatas]